MRRFFITSEMDVMEGRNSCSRYLCLAMKSQNQRLHVETGFGRVE